MTEEINPAKMQDISALDALSDKDLRKVIDRGSPVHIPAGWSLMWEGAASDKAYLIVEGKVSVRQQGSEIARLGPGEIIGEMSIVNQKLRSATVVTETELDALHFSRDQLNRLMEQVPAFGEAMRALAIKRAQNT